MRRILYAAVPLALAGVIATNQLASASDHDDGEMDLKGRALNLTDHFAFKSPADPTKLSLIMYFNPRSLPGKQYFMSTNARYELHVSKAANKTAAPTLADDFVFRFEAMAPDASGVQQVKLTVLKNGTEAGSMMGATTAIGPSKAGNITPNMGSAGGIDLKWFVGPRADSFVFDVVRFFQVRSFLAQRFFGGAGGAGDASATLADNCRGDKFLGPEAGGVSDGDNVNLFNPPSCAPDFTKNYNVMAIVLNVPINQLGGSVFDTWSTISVLQ